ncbi:unnamed protein product [Chrysoparadoxa australica]
MWGRGLVSLRGAGRSAAKWCGGRVDESIYRRAGMSGAPQLWKGLASEAAAVEEAPADGTGAPPPMPDDVVTEAPEKVVKMVDDMLALNVLEFSQLLKLYKERTGITDAVMAPVGVAAAAGGGAEPDEPKKEKELFDLKVTGFDAKSKIKVIKEVRGITGLGLKEAKELVESLPKVVKKDIKKEEAEELMEKLKAIGAEVHQVDAG